MHRNLTQIVVSLAALMLAIFTLIPIPLVLTAKETERTSDEKFDWSDGEKTTRVWTINSLGYQKYSGLADDVTNEAEGALVGNVLNWNYRLDLEVDGTTWNVKFDDWMFKVSEEMVINKATISKFGIDVGEVTIVFKKY